MALKRKKKEKEKLIGQILIELGIITSNQLTRALEIQKKEKKLLGSILVNLGYAREKDIVKALIVQYGFPYIAINRYEINQEILSLIPKDIARISHVIPLDRVGNVLSVVMADPLNESLIAKLAKMTRYKIMPFIATRSEIDQVIAKAYKN